MQRQLHPHQVRAMELLRHSVAAGKRRPMIQAPTGAGKTLLAAAVIEGALRKNKRVIFTVPRLSLIDQTVERLQDEGITELGVMQGYHPLTNAMMPVQVCTLQTLARRQLPSADVVLIDEAHENHDFARQWMTDEAWTKVPFIGLSATPWTKGLGQWFDDLIIPTTTDELIEQGYLSKFRVFAPTQPDLKGVKTVAGDYHVGQLSKAMRNVKITADVVRTWLEKGEDRPTLCYAVDLAHARMIQQQFQEAGVECGYVDGDMDRLERNKVAELFHARTYRVVVSVGTLTIGIDWDVRCIILARPTKSEILYVQIIGRGLRPAMGKQECLILDHSSTTQKLGFVTEIHHKQLDDGKPRQEPEKKPEERLPKPCPKCAYLKPAKIHECPNCGFAPERRSRVQCEDGELGEISHAARKADRETKQRWYSGLIWIGRDRGYKPGWPARQYREKFGVWPKRLYETPIHPNHEIFSWAQSRMIKYAKSRRHDDAQASV